MVFIHYEPEDLHRVRPGGRLYIFHNFFTIEWYSFSMKNLFSIGLILVMAASFVSLSYGRMMDTPYGDYCPKCSKYGVCPEFLSVEESREAVESYYNNKGVDIGRIRGKGRFIKIELLRDGNVEDIILFDRKTGRIRSVY